MNLKIGTLVAYYQSGSLYGYGEITGRGTEHGMTVYDVDLESGRKYWGYRDQFVIVNKNKKPIENSPLW